MLFIRLILLPFTILYALCILIRNLLYKGGILTRMEFDFPVICVGNLAAGGTGKTPHIEWIIEKFINEYKISLLSRGYKRKTKGYVFADENATPDTIGDESFQVKRKFPEVTVAVCENRLLGIPHLIGDAPESQFMLMDDGFQHLPVKAGLYILLTDYHNLFTSDWLIPSGLLREFRSGYKRAHIIVVTKCPTELSPARKAEIRKKIQPLSHQQLLFSSIQYDKLIPVFEPWRIGADKQTQVLCFSGIANAALFEQYLATEFTLADSIRFKDHHHYMENDFQNLLSRFNQIESKNKIMVCTEKDVFNLRDAGMGTLPVYACRIGLAISDAAAFWDAVMSAAGRRRMVKPA